MVVVEVVSYTLFDKGASGAGTVPVPTLEPVLCVSTAKDLAPDQENWLAGL